MKSLLSLSALLFFFSIQCYGSFQKPKLIVTIVIDQFRSDYLTRFESKFLPAVQKNKKLGGFQYLMTRGAYYPQGQYDILQSMTAPGHATILTGSYPYQAGIPINSWFDRDQNKMIYCTEDQESPLLGSQAPISAQGRSPRNLLATTLGDEIKNAIVGSRVVSISLKDRSAILLGGHRADLALWYHTPTSEWVSSRYYFPDGKLPAWVEKINRSPVPSDLRSNAPNLFGLPVSAEMTEKMAEGAIEAYNLGKGPSIDLLAVSFSTHDYVGHRYGPNSLEAEKITLLEDQLISRLINFIHDRMPNGLEDVVFAFTADHGAPSNPEWLKANKMQADRIDEEALAESLSHFLDNRFGTPKSGKWITQVFEFNFYLNHSAIQEKKLALSEVESAAQNFLRKVPGAAFVFTSTDYQLRRLPPGMHKRQILHTYVPGKSGDVIMIPKPFYVPGKSTDTGTTHLTGYSYDRTVPILLVGKAFRPGRYAERAEVVDIAPTLSFITGTVSPSMSEGRTLSEAIRSASHAQ
jgi:predicted AlkP superfamily pyrophosphatase or phosphodiesterase